MSPAGRAAYLRWLASPALVANNDRVPILVSVLPHPTGLTPPAEPSLGT
jgi:hypothetical protein